MKKPIVRWNDFLDEYLFRQRMKGEALRFIASAINCSPDSVRHRFRRLCLMKGIDPKSWKRRAAA